MPDLNDQHKELVNRDTSYFLGDPGRILKNVTEGADGDGGEGGGEGEGEGGAPEEESEDNRSEEAEI